MAGVAQQRHPAVNPARERVAGWLHGDGDAPEGFEVLAPARAKTGRHGAMLLPFDALLAAVDSSAHAPLDFVRDERMVGDGDVAE